MAGNDFTPRMQQIVLALLKENGPVPVKRLADQIHISKRTVQRELEYIPRVLKKYGLTFCSKPEPVSGWRETEIRLKP